MNRIIIENNNLDGIVLDKLWNDPSCVQRAYIRGNKLYLFCCNDIPIFVSETINIPNTNVKGIKFVNNKIQLTI